MAAKPETKIVEKLKTWIAIHGGHYLKLYGNDVQRAGEPDLVGSIPVYLVDRSVVIDVHFWVEVKMPGEEARPLQLERLKRWNEHGYAVGVVHSVQEMDALIRQFAMVQSLHLQPSKMYEDWMLTVRFS